MEGSDRYDVILCGGGLAGTAAAIEIRRRCPSARVLVAEAGTYPRAKVCGEFLSYEALDVLKALIGEAQPMFINAPRIGRVRLRSKKSEVMVKLRHPALSVRRQDLDFALWQAAIDAGAECRERVRITSVVRHGNDLVVLANGRPLHAAAVINAAGRWSELNSSTVGRTSLIGIKCHFAVPQSIANDCTLHFFPGGYLGCQPIGERAVCASALVDARQFRDMASVLRAAGLSAEAHNWRPLMDTLTCPPVRFAPATPTAGAVLNAGDAAAFIDPFAGDGMSLAMHSARLAAESVADRLSGQPLDEVAERYRREYLARFGGAFRAAALLRRVALSQSESLRGALLSAMRFGSVAQMAFAKTRAA